MKALKLTLALAALGLSTSAVRADITVKGSDTLVILAQKWAETYMGAKPGTKPLLNKSWSG